MKMENEKETDKQRPLTEYEKYCRMMAQQQEEEIDELCFKEMPEGQFVREH